MRISERTRRPVTLLEPVESDGLRLFDVRTAITLRAAVLPMTGAASVQRYGERAQSLLTLLCDGDVPLQRGMGVYVDEDRDNPPDYVIALPPEKWRFYTRAVLESLPEGSAELC